MGYIFEKLLAFCAVVCLIALTVIMCTVAYGFIEQVQHEQCITKGGT